MLSRHLRFVLGAACLVSCNADVQQQPASRCVEGHPCADTSALVAMGDQSSSGVGAVGLGGAVTNFFGVDLGTDPQLSVSAGRAFYVARDLDTIFELSPRCGEPLCRWSTRRAGRQGTTNPQDVAVAPDGTLWVPRFGMPNVAILDASGGEAQSVDLPDLDGDGNPNASAIRILDVDGAAKAFVAVGLLDDRDPHFASRRPSALVVIDVASRKVERTIALRGRNPFNFIVEQGSWFFLADAGNFAAADETDAGVERIDPRHPDRGPLLVPETELGGSTSAVAVTEGCAAAIVADPTEVNATSVVTFDPDSGAALRTAKKGGPLLAPSAGFDFWAIAWSEGKLLVGDRRRGAKGYPIHVFDKTGRCDLTERAEPLWVAQKPVALRALP